MAGIPDFFSRADDADRLSITGQPSALAQDQGIHPQSSLPQQQSVVSRSHPSQLRGANPSSGDTPIPRQPADDAQMPHAKDQPLSELPDDMPRTDHFMDPVAVGRTSPIARSLGLHAIFACPLLDPISADQAEIFLAAGCYWGLEEIMWQLAGVENTCVGFMGGVTSNPTYSEVCSGMTGHAETVRVVYRHRDPDVLAHILRTFWECHDPTSLNRQGNDVGTQYRSAIFPTTTRQAEMARWSRDQYDVVLRTAGHTPIVTDIVPAEQTSGFYPAEDSHQQYLFKVPHGYRCHVRTGLACPMPGTNRP
ncbi:peptide-methionine (S)-S-oxide reductase MsrA [Trueperella sp. LYQ143]|uniref:peptide-methionine (S)-S-oxide reductase MsrA n=1 Tax=unclassified Trueperella TaxID=2630174 RepID=UPI003983B349